MRNWSYCGADMQNITSMCKYLQHLEWRMCFLAMELECDNKLQYKTNMNGDINKTTKITSSQRIKLDEYHLKTN